VVSRGCHNTSLGSGGCVVIVSSSEEGPGPLAAIRQAPAVYGAARPGLVRLGGGSRSVVLRRPDPVAAEEVCARGCRTRIRSDGKLAISDACEQVANTLRTSFSNVVVKLEFHDKRPPKAPRRSRDEGTIVTRAGVALVTVLTLALATGVRRLVSASCE
jgi:hypothetical protein